MMDTMAREKYLSRNIITLNIIFAVFIMGVIAYYNLSLQDSLEDFNKKNDEILSTMIEKEKKSIKSEVHNVINQINYQKLLAKQKVKDRLQFNTQTAIRLASTIYSRSVYKEEREIKKEIISILKTLSNSDKDNEIFIYEIRGKNNIIAKLMPSNTLKEGLNCADDMDSNGYRYVEAFYNKIQMEEKGYIDFTNLKTVKDKIIKEKRISYASYFEPFNWIIGYSKNVNNLNKNIKNSALEMLKVKGASQQDRRVTIFKIDEDDNLDLLMAPIKGGEEIAYLKKEYQNEVNRNALNRGIVFKSYRNGQKKDNIAYFFLYSDWQWLISAGVDVDKLKREIENKKREIDKKYDKRLKESIFIGFLILLAIGAISFVLIQLVKKIMFIHKREIISKEGEIDKKEKITFNYQQQLQENRGLLEEATRKKQMIFSNTKIAFLFLNDSFKIVEINSGFCKLFNFTEAQIIGKEIKELYLSNKDFMKFEDEVEYKIKQGEMLDIEQNLLDSQNKERFCHITGSSVSEKDSDLIVLAIIDISFKKKINDNIDSLKRNKEIKNEFISNISHDLKTPLNAIKGFAQLLENDNLTETQKKYLESIKSSGDNLLLIINDIIDISLLEHKKIKLYHTSIDLEYFFTKIRDIFVNKISEKNLKFTIEIDDNIPRFIISDQTRLRQIIINIVNNSIKYTEKGFIKIEISSKINQLIIIISDSGVGITPTNLARIQRAFKDTASKDEVEFLGIGFSIVKKLTQLLNCKITINSEINDGTKIQLIYPIDLNRIKNHDKLKKTKFVIDKSENETIKELNYKNLDLIWKLEELKNSKEYKNNLDVLNFKECKVFVKNVHEIGKRFKNREVLNYTKNLISNLKAYDIEGIEQNLDEFSELIERL